MLSLDLVGGGAHGSSHPAFTFTTCTYLLLSSRIQHACRWLEDPDAPETAAWVTSQNELTQRILAQCEGRQQFKDLFTKL